GARTVSTLASESKGAGDEFAVVIPVPTFLKREQIHVADRSLVEHLDAYSAPRLVESFDANPCRAIALESLARTAPAPASAMRQDGARAKNLGVTIEAQYTVGEYDILILSAQQSS